MKPLLDDKWFKMGALDTRVGNVHKGEQIPPQNLMLFGQMLDLILLKLPFFCIFTSLCLKTIYHLS